MRKLLLATTMVVFCSGAVYAQTAGSNASNVTTVGNQSGSSSSSVSNPTLNASGAVVGNGNSSAGSTSAATANTRSNSNSSAIGTNSSATVIINTGALGGRRGSSGSNSSSGSSGSGGSSGSNGGTAPASGASGTTGTAGTSAPATGATGTSSDPTIHYAGSYTVRNTPELVAPSINGGNPCAIGVSGGVALPGVGVSGGATWADAACERRQAAALLHNMGHPDIAYQLMCQDKNVREARKIMAEPCKEDMTQVSAAQPRTAVAAAPPPAFQPAVAVPVVAAPAAPVQPAVAVVKRQTPDWCEHVSAGDLRQNPRLATQCRS